MMLSVFDWVGNTVGKGENAGYQHFLLFPHCFQKDCYTESLKVVIVWERVKLLTFLPMRSFWFFSFPIMFPFLPKKRHL